MAAQYGPYVMYILSQMLQKRQNPESQPEADFTPEAEDIGGTERTESTESTERRESTEWAGDIFTRDETGAEWHRQTNLELLQHFCREGYAQARRHGHFLTGTCGEKAFIAVPGRFLLEDQPAGGKTGFTLWQPLRGGEELYRDLEDMDEETARQVFGYWIAALDSRTLEISEV